MVTLPAAEDCARLDYSGGSPPGDGLLPIPQPHGQARSLMSPFPSKTPSVFCTPPARRTTTASLSPMVKPKISRSTSAILPTPLACSPPLVDGVHLLKGRLPFKVVQGNGPGNNKIDAVQRNNSKKTLDGRNGAHKKMSGSTGHSVNVKVRDHVDLQGARSTLKPPHDGGDLKGQPKKVDVRNHRSLEQSQSVKEARVRRAQQFEIPPVTILQRPKNEEAAAELFAKFFQKSAEQDVVVNEEWVDHMSENMQNFLEMTLESKIERQSSTGGLSDSEALEDMPCQTISSPCRTSDAPGPVVNMCTGVPPSCPTACSTLVTQSDVEILRASNGALKDFMCESVGEELAPWERWAGPSYINSPPPSALPLPRFSRKHSKIESLDIECLEEIVSDQVSTPPSSLSPLYASFSGQRQLVINSDAVVSATKDLKRILNLDLCRI